MRINGLTTTNFKRHISAIYIIKELLANTDNISHDEAIDVLLNAYYGLVEIHEEINNIYKMQCKERAAKMNYNKPHSLHTQ